MLIYLMMIFFRYIDFYLFIYWIQFKVHDENSNYELYVTLGLYNLKYYIETLDIDELR